MEKRSLRLCAMLLLFLTGMSLQAQNLKSWVNAQSQAETATIAQYDMSRDSRGANVATASCVNPVSLKAASADDGLTVYGWSMYNSTDYFKNISLCKFNTNAPATLERFGAPSAYTIKGGAYADDGYYAIAFYYTYPKALVKVDLESGAVTEVADYMQQPDVYGSVDMSYDFNSSTMYMLTNSGHSTTALLTVDLTTGAQTFVNPDMGLYFITLAINAEGDAYGISSTGSLYNIRLTDGTSTLIGATGCTPRSSFQSMEFDRGTNTLYWASYISGKSDLRIVNIETAAYTSLGTIGDHDEIVGLYIPFSLCDPAAPAVAQELTLTPDAPGSLIVHVSATAPTVCSNGDALAAIDSVLIYRNKEVVACLTGITPGGAIRFADQNVATSGEYQYKVVAFNAAGSGMAAKQMLFVGHDLPLAPASVVAVRQDVETIALTWSPVTQGINGGYLDLATLRYKVIRTNDSTVLAADLTDTAYTDGSLRTLAAYSYTVMAYNADGEGGMITSVPVVTGPVQSLPQTYNFNDAATGALWTIVDANADGTTFAVKYNYLFKESEMAYLATTVDADDWTISPLFHVAPDMEYKIVMMAHATNTLYFEKFEVYLLSDYSTAEPQLLGTFSTNAVDRTEFRVNLSKIAAGDYNVAIRCVSEKATESFAIATIDIAENHDGHVRGDVYSDKNQPVEGVTVSLEGTAFTTVTDAEGNFQILNVPAGTYTVHCNKVGYFESTAGVTVKELATTNAELDIVGRKIFTIAGKTLNEYGEALPNLPVALSGYVDYATVSDASGAYCIDGVYEDDARYVLSSHKSFYLPAGDSIALCADTTVDLVLRDQILNPTILSVESDEQTQEPTLSWYAPGEEGMIRYYSDVTYGDYVGGASTNQLAGVALKSPILLEKLTWHCYTYMFMNLFVIELGADGSPTTNVLYQTRLENIGAIEMTHELPTPIYAPNGCAVLMSCDNSNVSIQLDQPTAEYPFMFETNIMTPDYTTGVYSCIEDLGEAYQMNMHIAGSGIVMADSTAPAVTYNVYRTGADSIKTLLCHTADVAATDSTWSALAVGEYRYTVKTLYRNGQESTGVSAAVEKSVPSAIENLSAVAAYQVADRRITLASGTTGILYAADGRLIDRSIGCLDLSTVPAGVYMLYTRRGNHSQVVKLLVK